MLGSSGCGLRVRIRAKIRTRIRTRIRGSARGLGLARMING